MAAVRRRRRNSFASEEDAPKGEILLEMSTELYKEGNTFHVPLDFSHKIKKKISFSFVLFFFRLLNLASRDLCMFSHHFSRASAENSFKSLKWKKASHTFYVSNEIFGESSLVILAAWADSIYQASLKRLKLITSLKFVGKVPMYELSNDRQWSITVLASHLTSLI